MTIGEAPIGATLAIGSSWERPDLDVDRTWMKVSNENDFIMTNDNLYLDFDAPEPLSDSRARRRFGNNFFPHSNVMQFLNARGRDWFRQAHKYDDYPFYRNSIGFLSCFSDEELKLLVDRDIDVAVPLGSRKEFSKVYHTTCKVCLPSATELGYTPQDETMLVEGPQLPGADAFLESIRYNTVMTRSGITDAGHIIAFCGRMSEAQRCSQRMGVRPMIRLDGNVELSGTTGANGTLYIKSNEDSFVNEFLKMI